jgi:ubiquinone/menaquinone biosynthesis C-methylase UbiE
LDYGCGKGKDADLLEFVKYDPFYFPHFPTEKFELITCNYVLNTLPDEAERQSVLDKIMELLLPQGEAYISVRADRKNLNGYTRKGTYQGYHPPMLPLLHKGSGFEIYHLKNA